jgi:hypothetical protein
MIMWWIFRRMATNNRTEWGKMGTTALAVERPLNNENSANGTRTASAYGSANQNVVIHCALTVQL